MADYWPELTEYSESVQSPGTNFRDPDLRRASVEQGPLGPKPLSGNFATVYHLTSANGRRSWAVRCFNRRLQGRQARSLAISDYLNQAKLPFAVRFDYQEEGILVRGQWFPIVKMDWVEGQTLDVFIDQHQTEHHYLGRIFDLWCRVEPELRSKQIAHGDLQHGNVMLFPGRTEGPLKLCLIDYDGLWIPELANTVSGEVGHPAYQHPDRSRQNVYTAEIDRFPHLVIATSLKCLSRPGLSRLWDTYHRAGEHLLLTQKDLASPADSAFLHELWETRDAELQAWAELVALASKMRLTSTPRLTDRMIDGRLQPLQPEESTAPGNSCKSIPDGAGR